MKTAHPCRHARSRQRGVSAILVAVCAVILIGLAGLALDLAFVRSTGQSLQAAADAASLAAARLVKLDSASTQFQATRQAAVNIALVNEAAKAPVQLDPNPQNAPGGDVVVGHWDPQTRTFTPTTQNPDAVRVIARRTASSAGGPVSLLFGRLFGATTSDVARTAVARADLAGAPLVLLLSDGKSALAMNGNPLLDALAGDVHVNSDADCAVKLNGGVLSSKTLSVAGTACVQHGQLNTLLTEGAGQRADPLQTLPPPTFSVPALPAIQGSGSYPPGYYEGIVMHGGTATLQAGEYVLGSKGLRLAGNAKLLGDGVLLYLQQPGKLELQGTATLQVVAPDSGTYQGVALFQDRRSSLVSTVTGNSRLDVQGTCYLPGGTLELHGNCGCPKVELGQVVCGGLQLSGASELTVTGLGLRPPVGPSPVLLTQ